jgi:hypothetical protein
MRMGRPLAFFGLACLALPVSAPAGEEYSVDPYRREVQDFSIFGETSVLVSRTSVAGLCGDADGCTLRLLGYYLEGYSDPRFVVVRSLVTDPTGSQWELFDGETLLALGHTGNETAEQLTAHPVRGHWCRLRDDPASNQYLLVAQSQDFFGGVRCVLRIYD